MGILTLNKLASDCQQIEDKTNNEEESKFCLQAKRRVFLSKLQYEKRTMSLNQLRGLQRSRIQLANEIVGDTRRQRQKAK